MTISRFIDAKILGVATALLLAGGCAAQDKGATTKPYTLSTCIVSNEPLDSMGKPAVYNYNGQEIKFCCSGCEDDFKKDPEKYLKKLQAGKAPATAPAAH